MNPQNTTVPSYPGAQAFQNTQGHDQQVPLIAGAQQIPVPVGGLQPQQIPLVAGGGSQQVIVIPATGQQSAGQGQLQPGTIPPKTTSRAHKWFGALQIVCGIVCFIANCVLLGELRGHWVNPSFIGCGIWGGIMFIVAGTFGIKTGKTLQRCALITTLVMSSISAVGALICIIVSSIGISNFYYLRHRYGNGMYNLGVVKFFYSIFLVFGIIEFVVAICQASFACYYTCKGNCCLEAAPQQPIVVYVNTSQPGSSQTQGQMTAEGQPMGYNPPPYSSVQGAEAGELPQKQPI